MSMNRRERTHRGRDRLATGLVVALAAGVAVATAASGARAAGLGVPTAAAAAVVSDAAGLPALPLLPGRIVAAPGRTAAPAGTPLGGAGLAGAPRLPAVAPVTAARLPVDPLVRTLIAPPPLVVSPPAAPQQALAAAVTGFSRDLGVVRDPAPEIAAAHLSDRLAGLLAGMVDALHACDRLSNRLIASQPFRHGVEGVTPLSADAVRAIRSCALTAEQTALHLEAELPAAVAADDPGGLDLWPVLRFSPSGTGQVYRYDYALLIDMGGHAQFLDNAGGNLLDVKRGPAGLALQPGPARGCQEPYPDATSGRVVRGPHGERLQSNDGPECVISAALLLAMGGDDQFGALTPPQFPDDQCTADPEESRIGTLGSGTAGVGLLIERGSHNLYIGRAQSEGTGHLGGVGLLLDQGEGDNTYLAVATSQGMALLGGTGLLIDLGHGNRFDYYMPRPLDPRAQAEEDGAGGIVNDEGLFTEIHEGQHQSHRGTPDRQPGGVCDNVERSLQGIGLLGGAVGVLLDTGGDNLYRAVEAPPDTFFIHQFNLGHAADVILSHCNQGCGLMGAVGVLADLHDGGVDSYLNEHDRPWTTHRDGAMQGPAIYAQPDPGGIADLSQVSLSLFIDRHTGQGTAAPPAAPDRPWIDRLRSGPLRRS
jgi:hypothetical protein